MGKNIIICTWCTKKDDLYLGPGKFRDVDSDVSYGIPVCCRCGGLGMVVEDSNEFQESTDNIMKLRFAYCPLDNQQKLPPSLKFERLKEYLSAVKKHYEIFGNYAKEECFAKDISNGSLDNLIKELEHTQN